MERDRHSQDGIHRENKHKNILYRKKRRHDYVDVSPDYTRVILSSLGNSTIRRMVEGGFVQAKLDVSAPDDFSEKQADQIAEQVVKGNSSGAIQPKIEKVQAKGSPGRTVSTETEAGIKNLKGKGAAISKPLREYFEPRLGVDMGNVRIHTGHTPNKLAETVNARAFTHGNDIVFKDGQYLPGTIEGKKLIAHELVHTVQQQGGLNAAKDKTAENGREGKIQKKQQIENIGWYTELNQTLKTVQRAPVESNSVNDVRIGTHPENGYFRCVIDLSSYRSTLVDHSEWAPDSNTRCFIINLNNTTLGTSTESPILVNWAGIREVRFALQNDGSTNIVVEADNNVCFLRSGRGSDNKIYYDFNVVQTTEQTPEQATEQITETNSAQTSVRQSVTGITVGDNQDRGFIRCTLQLSSFSPTISDHSEWNSDSNTKCFIINLSNTTLDDTLTSPIAVNMGGVREVRFAEQNDGSTNIVVEADSAVSFLDSGHGRDNKIYYDFYAIQATERTTEQTPEQTNRPTTFSFTKPQRSVHTVFIHCSASDNPDHDNAATIRSWHENDNGWDDIGYHYIIRKNGTIETGRSLENDPYAQASYNPGTIAICLTGLSISGFTEAQFTSLRSICNAIENEYTSRIRFRGHREVANKLCPVFDYKSVLSIDNNGYR